MWPPCSSTKRNSVRQLKTWWVKCNFWANYSFKWGGGGVFISQHASPFLNYLNKLILYDFRHVEICIKLLNVCNLLYTLESRAHLYGMSEDQCVFSYCVS